MRSGGGGGRAPGGLTGRAARLAITASRSELLYAGSGNFNCSDLSKTDDLPFDVVRLTAQAPAGVPPDQVRYQWIFPKPALGPLLADVDLGPDEEEPAIRALCADLGNGCELTAEQLKLYNHPTILWFAPTCDVLPANTTRQFRGGRVRIGARVSVGKRRVGKGAVVIGFGRIGSVTLLARPPLQSRFDDGLGKPGGVNITLDPEFGLRFDPGNASLPAIDDYVVDSGGGGTVTLASPCRDDPSLTACGGGIVYGAAGKFVPLGSVVFKDGSQLCDKMTVSVLTAPLQVKLDVSIAPKRRQYVPGDPARGSVHVRVQLRNTSPPAPLNNILILGNALTCDSEVRIGSTTITKTTEIDLQHCSATVHQPCNSDADCAPGHCENCQQNEVCLTSSHCSAFGEFGLGCTTDRDCQPPRCQSCNPSDTCVHVLPLASVTLGAGDAVTLVDSTIDVANVIPTPARVVDTWTGHTFNAGDATDVAKYSIAARTTVKPAAQP